MRDTRFDEMARTVHLMIIVEIRPAFGGLVELVVGVEIAVRQLHGTEQIDRLISESR